MSARPTPGQERRNTILLSFEDACEDFGFRSFDCIARKSGVERFRIRREVRLLARHGMLEFCRGLWTDDGTPAGSGYGITRKGREAIQALRAAA